MSCVGLCADCVWTDNCGGRSSENRLEQQTYVLAEEKRKAIAAMATDLEVAVAERDGAIAERDEAIADRDSANRCEVDIFSDERQQVMDERDAAIAGRDDALRRCNNLSQSVTRLRAERDAALAEKAAAVRQRQ